MDLLFRFIIYTAIGLTCEIVSSVAVIELAMGVKVTRRMPRKYLEGFVSLYMIPIHGLGVLFAFEPMYALIGGLYWALRLVIWGVLFVFTEALCGFLMDKALGFYPWDYYVDSKFKIFKRGYSLWTLIPLWGLYGLFLEVLVRILVGVSPYIRSLI